MLHDGRLYIVNDNTTRSFLAAVDTATGEQVWRIDRDETENWSTPFVCENELRTEIVTTGRRKIRSYDLDGNQLWELGGMTVNVVPTPFTGHGLLYLSSGYPGGFPRPVYVRPGASGDISLAEGETSNDYIAWYQPLLGTYSTSALVRPRLPALPRRRGGRGDLRPPAHSSRPRIHRVAVGLPAGRIADGQVVLALARHFESRVLQSGDDIGVSMLSRAPDRGKSSSAAGGESVHSGTGVDLYVRWSNVAADPDVTSGERTYRQGSDRPCSGLRWPRPANLASGQSVHLPSGLYDAHPLWRAPRIRTVIDIEVVSQHANAADATTAQRGVRCT